MPYNAEDLVALLIRRYGNMLRAWAVVRLPSDQRKRMIRGRNFSFVGEKFSARVCLEFATYGEDVGWNRLSRAAFAALVETKGDRSSARASKSTSKTSSSRSARLEWTLMFAKILRDSRTRSDALSSET